MRYLDTYELEVLVRELPERLLAQVTAYLESLTAAQQNGLSGVRDRLAVMAESDVGRWLDPETEGVASFDLRQTIEQRAVVYFSLQSDRRPLLAHMLGAAIVQDLQSAVAALQGRPIPTVVVIDEFSALAAEQVSRLFGRARAGDMSLGAGHPGVRHGGGRGGGRALQEQADGNPDGRDRPPSGGPGQRHVDTRCCGHPGCVEHDHAQRR